jgi:hypothetical protein
VFFIHLDDPGFPDPPWPGQRRLGPYETAEEAYEQAVSDAASGAGLAVGIYDEETSLLLARMPDIPIEEYLDMHPSAKRQVDLPAAPKKGIKAVYSRSRIATSAAAEANRRHKERVAQQQGNVDLLLLQKLLPEGVDAKDLL